MSSVNFEFKLSSHDEPAITATRLWIDPNDPSTPSVNDDVEVELVQDKPGGLTWRGSIDVDRPTKGLYFRLKSLATVGSKWNLRVTNGVGAVLYDENGSVKESLLRVNDWCWQ